MENKGTKLILEIEDKKITYETNAWDMDAYDLIEAFAGLMVGQTFQMESIIACMNEFVKNHTDEEN